MTEPLHNLLEQHFDTAFAAPDGIKKLRELILTLAMQGKLVAQDPNDPPASELLKQIEAEKQRLVKAGTIKQPKPLPPIRPEEVPYELPEGWKWVRLTELAYPQAGFAFKSRMFNTISNGLPLIRIRDVGQPFTSTYYAGEYREEFIVSRGDYLISMDGEFRVATWKLDTGLLNQRVSRLIFHSNILPRNYTAICLQEQLKNLQGVKAYTTVDHLSGEQIAISLIPLPPLPEQHRIVAKIDQLMAKCDELEALRKFREEKRRAVHVAAIKQLLDTTSSFPRKRESSSSEELDLCSLSAREQTYGGDGVSVHGWNFIQQHFSELYTVKENVSELRKAILQLAVMGRLVPQDPNDPPASELLKQIEAEKQGLYASSPRKNRGSNGVKDLDSRLRGNDGIKTKSLPSIKLEEIPYQLPRGWEWVRLGDVSLSSDSGWSPQCLPERRVDGQWGILKVSAVSWGKFNPYENKALPSDKEPRSECEVKPGDFLLSRANTDELVARSVIVDAAPEKLMMSDKIVRFVLSRNINKYFINYVNGMNFSRNYYIANASGTSSSMKNVSRQVMAELPIPLPPLPEQHRIVAKVDQLMILCDQLEQQIDAASTKQRELLDAVMSSVS